MPSLIEILLDPVSLYLLALYAALMLWEAIFPARKLPYIPYWHVKGIISFFLFSVHLFAFVVFTMAAFNTVD